MTQKNSVSSPLTILVVDDEPNIRKVLSLFCEERGHRVVAVSNPQDAMTQASHTVFDLAFVDLRLGTHSGLDLIPSLLSDNPWIKIVMITAFASIATAVEAIKRGAMDYLPKPFEPEQVELILRKVRDMRALEFKVQVLQEALGENNPEADLTTGNPKMQQVLTLARQVAASDATVLLSGENGTGKGILARAIHAWSPRAGKPFSVVACPSLSPELLESELFGHVKGAFTGAVRDNPGRMAMSEGGTLFLDEIGALPYAIQPKLLRFLQDREFERVGEPITRKADVRIIAATNQDLHAAVENKEFREDLYYRLNVISMTLPTLAQRREDILALAQRFLSFFMRKYNRRVSGFSDRAKEALLSHPWPGNIRELRNVVERAVILCQTDWIGVEHLPFPSAPAAAAPRVGDRVSLDAVEEEHIRRVLAGTRSLQEAAEVLGIDQATLWRKRKQYGI